MSSTRWSCALSALALGAWACQPARPLPKPEHVLLIVVDTLRADHTTPYGYGRETSPALKELAAQGVRFENAISQCSWTSPSMVSLFTGQYVAGERLALPADRATLAEAFQRAGFQTGAFVSNELINAENQFTRGFDVFERIAPYAADDPIVDWIKGSKGRRTFTYVHLNEPHDPYGPVEPALERFKKTRDGALTRERLQFFERFSAEKQLDDFDRSVATIQTEIGGYDDDVYHSDRRIQNYVEALRASGQFERTAIVVTADHGEGLWTREAYDDGQRHKRIHEQGEKPTLVNLLMMTHGNQVHYELLHVPLILVSTGLEPGTVVKSYVENVDIVPTLLELCDVPAPHRLHGTSLLALARDARGLAKPYVFSHTRFVSTVIDQQGRQLILPTELGRCQFGLDTELYDLASDPQARRNLAAGEPELVEQLSRVVAERLTIGVPGEDVPISEENREILNKLGYGGDGARILDEPADSSSIPTDELIATLTDPKTQCLARLDVAKALAQRDLDDAQRAKLQALLSKEVSPSVKAQLARALAPR